MSNIFSPIKVKNVNFINRIVMAPMVRFGFKCSDGVMGGELLKDYLERSDKEIGLIISQVLSVSNEKDIAGGAGAYTDKHVKYLNKIAESYHKNNTRFFAQLGLPDFSFYDDKSKDVNKLTKQEIIKIKEWFINSARVCKKAGLDGIELHGAHTFFLNMMASSYSNKRQDSYGGDLIGRLNLAKEIIEEVKGFAGDEFIISYRMGWDDDLNTDIQTAKYLENIGVDMIHVSTGIPENRRLQIPKKFEYNDVVYTGCNVKENLNIPVIVVNDIKTINRGNTLVENNYSDFVAYGKPFLADSDFVKKSRKDMNYKSCFECNKCKWFSNGNMCPAQVMAKGRL